MDELSADQIPEPFVTLDFIDSFPYKYWISNWSSDESYPNGFRYKLLTWRTASTGMYDMILVLEEPGGVKTEFKHLSGSQMAIERTCNIFVDSLAEEYGLDFQEINLSHIMSSDVFEKEVEVLGWYEWMP